MNSRNFGKDYGGGKIGDNNWCELYSVFAYMTNEIRMCNGRADWNGYACDRRSEKLLNFTRVWHGVPRVFTTGQ